MAIKIYRPENQKTTLWSGGQTTELFIFPENSEFKKRDFDFRISTATIEVEESDFTPLSDFLRKIMVLKGELELNHENHHSISLKPFEQDSFSGDWNTKSRGKATDFNVIYRPEFTPIIEVVEINPMNSYRFEDFALTFFYIVEGEVVVEDEIVSEKSFVYANYESQFSIRAEIETKLIRVKF